MASGDKKQLKNILSLAKKDDKRITTGFYCKKQGCGKEIWFYPYF